MDDFELEIKTEFLRESKELLKELLAEFQNLKTNEAKDPIIERSFRFTHTIKSTGFAAGFNELSMFIHMFETLLVAVKNKMIHIDNEIINTLIIATKKITQCVEKLSYDFNASIDISSITSLLKSKLREAYAMNAERTFEQKKKSDTAVAASVEKTNNTRQNSKEHRAILIVDDEDHIIDILARCLQNFDMPILTARNGLEAIEIISQNKIELIFTDLAMPKLDGLEFIKKVRDIDQNIPVIFISAYAEKDELIKFLELGAFAFFPKPFDTTQVTTTARNALNMKSTKDEVLNLATLNFRAYITNLKISKLYDNPDSSEHKKAVSDLERYLDKISNITNSILAEKFKMVS